MPLDGPAAGEEGGPERDSVRAPTVGGDGLRTKAKRRYSDGGVGLLCAFRPKGAARRGLSS